MTQQEQIQKLKQLTGLDFVFTPASHSRYGVPSYTVTVPDDNLNKLNQISDMKYILRSHDDAPLTDVIIVDSAVDYERACAMSIMYMLGRDTTPYTTPIGHIGKNPVFLEPLPTNHNMQWAPIIEEAARAVAVVNVNGARLPFYVSSGLSGKEQEYGIPSRRWYPLMGVGANWFNKMPDMMENPYPELDAVAAMLESRYPASQLRDDAYAGKLPHRSPDFKTFQRAVNADFFEGVSDTHYGNYSYAQNVDRYLPRIIRRWRGNAANEFNLSPQLKTIMTRMADKLADILHMDIYTERIDGTDYIVFNTPKSKYDVLSELSAHGIVYNSGLYVTYSDRPGFALRADHLDGPELVRIINPFYRASERIPVNNVNYYPRDNQKN